MCVKCGKVFFSGTNVATQTVADGGALSFNKVISAGTSDLGLNSFTIDEAGIYLVIVDASGAPAAAGDIEIQLQVNGSVVDAYTSTATSTGPTDFVHVGFSAIVRVDPTVCRYVDNSSTIGVVNIGAEATYANMSITCVRL